jgi:hypothetical protein
VHRYRGYPARAASATAAIFLASEDMHRIIEAAARHFDGVVKT